MARAFQPKERAILTPLSPSPLCLQVPCRVSRLVSWPVIRTWVQGPEPRRGKPAPADGSCLFRTLSLQRPWGASDEVHRWMVLVSPNFVDMHIPCQFIQGLESERLPDATAGYAGGGGAKRFRFGNATPDRVTIANYGVIPRHWVEPADAGSYLVVTLASERRRARAAVGSLAVYSELEFMVRLKRWEGSRLLGIRAPQKQEKRTVRVAVFSAFGCGASMV